MSKEDTRATIIVIVIVIVIVSSKNDDGGDENNKNSKNKNNNSGANNFTCGVRDDIQVGATRARMRHFVRMQAYLATISSVMITQMSPKKDW